MELVLPVVATGVVGAVGVVGGHQDGVAVNQPVLLLLGVLLRPVGALQDGVVDARQAGEGTMAPVQHMAEEMALGQLTEATMVAGRHMVVPQPMEGTTVLEQHMAARTAVVGLLAAQPGVQLPRAQRHLRIPTLRTVQIRTAQTLTMHRHLEHTSKRQLQRHTVPTSALQPLVVPSMLLHLAFRHQRQATLHTIRLREAMADTGVGMERRLLRHRRREPLLKLLVRGRKHRGVCPRRQPLLAMMNRAMSEIVI